MSPLPRLVRPFLSVDRADIRAYVSRLGLDAREDESNVSLAPTRNRIRHQLIPALEALNPKVGDALVRLADTARAEDDWLEALTTDAAAGSIVADHDAVTVWVAKLDEAPLGLRRRLVRRAAELAGADMRAVGPADADAVLALQDGGAATLAGGVEVRLDGQKLVLRRERPLPPPVLGPTPVAIPGTTSLSTGWTVTTHLRARRLTDPATDLGVWRASMDADRVKGLVARSRHPGDRMLPLGLSGRSKSVQDLFVDERIEETRRAGWPVLMAEWGIAWLPGIRLDERAKVVPTTVRVLEIQVVPPWQ
jgi:tRNA(Ile)-lysidine synthase